MSYREPISTQPPELGELILTHRGVTDPDITGGTAVDWTRHWQGNTPAVFRPRDTAALAALVGDAQRLRVALCVQGGNTSLTGGATPYGEAVLSSTHLDSININTDAGRVTVGAGVTAGAVGRALAGTGWELGVDLASRDTATIGGMISTNAGGLRVLRWGQMGNQVIGCEAVLGDGTVLTHLDGADRDNTGPRWDQLLCGAEGTMGVITAATLRLVPTESPCTALIAFNTIQGAVVAAQRLRHTLTQVRSIELMLAEGVALVADHINASPPLDGTLHTAYLLVEAGGVHIEQFTEQLAHGVAGLDVTTTGATTSTGRHELWRWRERHTEAIAAAGIARKCDVSAPPHRTTELVERVRDVVLSRAPGATVVRFGHISEGNVHVSILDGNDEAEAAVLCCASELGGSISAEDGIGRQKRRLLGLVRSAAEITHLERLRSASDPHRILNPNIMIPQ